MNRIGILVVTATLVAGCTASPRPIPQPTPATSADEIAALLARPTKLPSVAPGAACPVSRPRPLAPTEDAFLTNVYSTGALFPSSGYLGDDTTLRLGDRTPAPDGLYEHKVIWAAAEGGYEGPAVVRVGRLDGSGSGRVRLYYDSAASRGDAVVFDVGPGRRDWPSGTFVSGPGCYAYQIDGRDYSEMIVFAVAR